MDLNMAHVVLSQIQTVDPFWLVVQGNTRRKPASLGSRNFEKHAWPELMLQWVSGAVSADGVQPFFSHMIHVRSARHVAHA